MTPQPESPRSRRHDLRIRNLLAGGSTLAAVVIAASVTPACGVSLERVCSRSGVETFESAHPAFTATLTGWTTTESSTQFFCGYGDIEKDAWARLGLYPIPKGLTVESAIAGLRQDAAGQQLGGAMPWTVAPYRGQAFDFVVQRPLQFSDFGLDCNPPFPFGPDFCKKGLKMRVGAISVDGIVTPNGASAGFTVFYASDAGPFDANLKGVTSFLESIRVTPKPILPATARMVLDLAGNGIGTTRQFSVSGTEWDVAWSYDCAGNGGPGNFYVNVYQGENATGLYTPVQFGRGGADTEYFSNGPGTFSLVVESDCPWHLTVTG